MLKKIKYKLYIKKMEVLTKIAKTIKGNKTLYKMLLNLWNMMKMMIGRKCQKCSKRLVIQILVKTKSNKRTSLHFFNNFCYISRKEGTLILK